VNYAAAKGGVAMLMRSLAQEVAGEGIRVNAIAPGAIATSINRKTTTGEAGDRMRTLIPYGRIGDVEDVARAAAWLASDEADYIVGTTLFIDGGMTLYSLRNPLISGHNCRAHVCRRSQRKALTGCGDGSWIRN